MMQPARRHSFVTDTTLYLAIAVCCYVLMVGLIYVSVGLAAVLTFWRSPEIHTPVLAEWGPPSGPRGKGPSDYLSAPAHAFGATSICVEGLPTRGHESWAVVPVEASDEPATARGLSI